VKTAFRLVAVFSLLSATALMPATPTIGGARISPITLVVNTSAVVTVSVSIADPSLIQDSVNLIRLGGAQPIILGQLHDDGQNGDAVAGDHTYTAQITFNESNIGQIQLQVSAAFRGLLQRVRLTLPPLFVQPPNASDQAIAGLIVELQAGNINAALQRFAASSSTTNALMNLNAEGRSKLISTLKTASLTHSEADLRVYTASWIEADGTTTPVEYSLAPNNQGQWVIFNW
jgi:hypothetical protein